MENTRILVIDDSPAMRSLVEFLLKTKGFLVTLGKDGQDGYDILIRDPGFSFVLCDINMPGLTGFELLEKLNEDPAISAPPFIMLTTENSSSAVDRAREIGAIGYIVKPFNPKKFVELVSDIWDRSQSSKA